MADELTEALLKEMISLLRIIARPQLTELRDRFDSSMLTSAKRREMWSLMNGNRTITEIAKAVGTSGEAVRQFVAEVEEKFSEAIEVDRSIGAARPRKLI